MAVCCPSTRVPALEDPSKYEKKGKIEEIEGVKTYIVGEPSKNAVFVIADVFGYDSGRHFGIADQLADEGYYVVMPDLFEGDRLTFADLGTPRLGEFIMKFKPNVWQPLADKIYAHLAAKGAQKIGAIGFCWGCWAIFHESSRGKLACGVNCHPSLRIESMMGGDVEALTEQVQAPMLMFPCQDDPENTQPDGSVMKILKGKKFGDACDCFRFGEQNHGFVSQGDLSVPATARDVEEAMKRTVAFFKGTLPA
uniref:Dienelactone hydrolase domain-containing protein n=1 Tax=Chromera velia CCMP2878 TaxID=1169474 RepID=A0A0G4I3T4_9ALVE|eukprot:Cvel_10756.t1-p1 / transcript=Cvel_10756.t1 / gene=Cvel_10756 / organism=Chromera_velia_CCMP2878 / gene_product=Uncharacterized AIM2 family protein C30D10.14, putative / transcript_product=Uncharacterized AIM2 family protein C30D10.14, putative / location=Cvel_scaffold656:43397-46129(+) / protein_length=251 / sequence_SO=supercontig / SO=protein_coding / is_pseudo=false